MKSIIKTVLIFSTFGVCYAQSEPESISGKDLIEKIDRSDLESNDMDDEAVIKNEIPKMEMPKLIFEKKPQKKIKVQKPVADTSEKTIKNQGKVIKESKSVKVIHKAPIKKHPTKFKKKSIVVSTNSKSINNLMNNDKIVLSKGVTYVYRLVKSKTIQYKFIGTLPLDSTALKASGKNSYYIKDVKKLIADSKTSKIITKKPVVTNQKTPTKTKSVTKKTIDKKQPLVKTTTDKNKKTLEIKHNHGRTISESIELKQLMKNDIIHIDGQAKLVIRRDRNTYKIHKYWLNGELDLRSRSLRKQSDIKYKVLKEYAPR